MLYNAVISIYVINKINKNNEKTLGACEKNFYSHNKNITEKYISRVPVDEPGYDFLSKYEDL